VIDEVRIFHTLFNSDNPAGLDDYLQDLNPDSLEVIKGGMVEVGFWPLAKKLSDEAWKEAKERTSKALTDDLTGAPDDAPKLTAEQLVGNECIRFQGLRVGYFALDREARLDCLTGSGVDLGRKPEDKIILNRIVSLKEDSKKNAA